MSPLTLSLPIVPLIDFTMSNARRFYSSMGNPTGLKGLNSGVWVPGSEEIVPRLPNWSVFFVQATFVLHSHIIPIRDSSMGQGFSVHALSNQIVFISQLKYLLFFANNMEEYGRK